MCTEGINHASVYVFVSHKSLFWRRRSGIYDQLKGLLEQAGKEVVEFSGIMANPTYAKAQEGAALARRRHVDFILAVGGGSVIDCCNLIRTNPRTLTHDEVYQILCECL